MTKYVVFSGSYFSEFRLNMEICEVNIPIQSEYRKILTRKNSVFGHFSRNGTYTEREKKSLPRPLLFLSDFVLTIKLTEAAFQKCS